MQSFQSIGQLVTADGGRFIPFDMSQTQSIAFGANANFVFNVGATEEFDGWGISIETDGVRANLGVKMSDSNQYFYTVNATASAANSYVNASLFGTGANPTRLMTSSYRPLGQREYEMGAPVVISPNSPFTINVKNTGLASSQSVSVTIHGRKQINKMSSIGATIKPTGYRQTKNGGYYIPTIFGDSVTLLGNATGTLGFTVGAFEEAAVYQLAFISTGEFSLNIKDSNGYSYNNKPIDSRCLGNNAFPTLLIDNTPRLDPAEDLGAPLYIYSQGTVNFEITDLSGAGNTVYVALIGKREVARSTASTISAFSGIRNFRGHKYIPFFMAANTANVGNDTITAQFDVGSSIEFIGHKIAFGATSTNANVFMYDDTQLSYANSSNGVNARTLGTGQLPTILQNTPYNSDPAAPDGTPISVVPNNKVYANLTDLSGSANSMSLTIIGKKEV